jgi:hypothetical protein
MSGLILIATIAALISGWKTEPRYRLWLWLPIIAFTLIWIATLTVFWPIITELYRIANGKTIKSDAEVVTLVQHWFTYDWLRVGDSSRLSIVYPVDQHSARGKGISQYIGSPDDELSVRIVCSDAPRIGARIRRRVRRWLLRCQVDKSVCEKRTVVLV